MPNPPPRPSPTRGREEDGNHLLSAGRDLPMRIGITCDVKSDAPLANGLPDDFQEEFDSPETVEAIATVLRSLGHTVEVLGDGRPLLERLLADPPDFVFNVAEGHGVGRSREAR